MKIDIFKDAVAEPRRDAGAPIPLFDKLINEDPTHPHEAPPKRFYNKFELIQSIEREVNRILNVRATIKRDLYTSLSEEKPYFGLPGMFGLPDFSQYDATNRTHWPHIAQLCQQTITDFEPRLKNIEVQILEFDKRNQELISTFRADFDLNHIQGEVTFPLAIGV